MNEENIEKQKNTHGNPNNELNLEKAWYLRDFEIKLSWERSKFFALFLAGVYYAYDLTDMNQQFLRLFILALGTIFSFVWYLTNRGSKAIYENWEEKINKNEYWKEFYKYSEEDYQFWKLFCAYPISPSRAMNFASFTVFIAFIVVYIYCAYKYYTFCWYFCIPAWFFILSIMVILALFFGFFMIRRRK